MFGRYNMMSEDGLKDIFSGTLKNFADETSVYLEAGERPIVEYCVVNEFDPSTLGINVNKMLKEGWRPYGTLCAVPWTDRVLCMQAMVRREDE